jgi:hypothetical protein
MEISDEDAAVIVAISRQRIVALSLIASILEIDSEDIASHITDVKKHFTMTLIETLKTYPTNDEIDARMWEAMSTCMQPIVAEEEAKAILKDLDKPSEE